MLLILLLLALEMLFTVVDVVALLFVLLLHDNDNMMTRYWVDGLSVFPLRHNCYHHRT